MQGCQKFRVLAVIGMPALAVPAFAAQPPGTPGDITTPPGRSQQQPVQKSDEHRIVGKVLQIDHAQGLVKLATEEGVLVVQAQRQVLQAINVGDTVSVPRSAAESPSASPRD